MAKPNFTVEPVITGTPEIGETLTGDNGTVTGDPVITYEYQWVECDPGIGLMEIEEDFAIS